MADTVYFIDFENVNSTANLDFSVTEESDEILILYTRNAEKISLDILKGMKGHLSVYKVPSGSQQLDMHLSSRLGFMIGRYGRTHRYVVISKDTDYARTIETWREEGIDVRQQSYLGKEPLLLPEKSASKKPENTVEPPKKEEMPEPAKKAKPKSKQKKKEPVNRKSELNTQVMKRFNKEFDPVTVGKIASIVIRETGKQGCARAVYTELVKTLKKENGLKAYRILKAENFLK